MRVLILDDSAVMRKIVGAALRQSGFEVDEVLQGANGREGLAAIEKAETRGDTLDLILCDVHMPCLDGLGFLLEKLQRNLAPGVPVVMVTADASDPHLLRAVAAGAQGYISKPFTIQQIQTILASVLARAANASSDLVADGNGGTQTAMRCRS